MQAENIAQVGLASSGPLLALLGSALLDGSGCLLHALRRSRLGNLLGRDLERRLVVLDGGRFLHRALGGRVQRGVFFCFFIVNCELEPEWLVIPSNSLVFPSNSLVIPWQS